jgi:hypothetical protein
LKAIQVNCGILLALLSMISVIVCCFGLDACLEFHAENKISIVLDFFVSGDVSFNSRIVIFLE